MRTSSSMGASMYRWASRRTGDRSMKSEARLKPAKACRTITAVFILVAPALLTACNGAGTSPFTKTSYIWPQYNIEMTRRRSDHKVLDVLLRQKQIIEVRVGADSLLDSDFFGVPSDMRKLRVTSTTTSLISDAHRALGRLGCGEKWHVYALLRRALKIVGSKSANGKCLSQTVFDHLGTVIYSEYELTRPSVPHIHSVANRSRRNIAANQDVRLKPRVRFLK